MEIQKTEQKFFRFFPQYKNLTAIYTTRLNGFSTNDFSSFNLGLHVGDNKDAVLKNRTLLAKYLNCTQNKIFFMDQIHSGNTYIIPNNSRTTSNTIQETDALITNNKNTAICAMGADCPQIGLYDKEKKVIAVIHAGWKGIVSGIITNTINSMQRYFRSQAEDIMVVTGAFLCSECFCVGEDTATLFTEKFINSEKFINKNSSSQITIDLKKAIKYILREEGVKSENISFLDMCTKCHNDLFFSYRGENKCTGRTVLALMLT